MMSNREQLEMLVMADDRRDAALQDTAGLHCENRVLRLLLNKDSAPSAIPLFPYEMFVLAQFNGAPRRARELNGNRHSTGMALSRMTKLGLLNRVGCGVYQKPAENK